VMCFDSCYMLRDEKERWELKRMRLTRKHADMPRGGVLVLVVPFVTLCDPGLTRHTTKWHLLPGTRHNCEQPTRGGP